MKTWSEEDFSTDGARVASYSLYKESQQVGAVYALADNVVKDIKTDPTDQGHGTKFLQLLMKRAKALEYDSLKVKSVTGQGRNAQEIKRNREKMEFILKKLGFSQTNREENNWEINLDVVDPAKIGC